MVDPVGNRDYYEYGRINARVGAGLDGGEKFSLNYGQAEKDSGKKEDEKAKMEADGVIAEFSSRPQGQYGEVGNGQKESAGEKEGADFGQAVERAKGFIGELVKAVRGIFAGIRKMALDFWNSDSAAWDGAGESETATEESGAIDVTEASQAINGGDGMETVEAEGFIERTADARPVGMEERREEAERYLESAGQGNRYVKNSDLLTYYDRSGRIVQMNGADKNRILHGDRTSHGI